MEDWEFLLQKEGERSWLSLEAANVEILEGRYRVVAHSARANIDVEIRITYQSTGENPPKRRSQKRSRRTNAEGLMVVIPFTYLKPGYWELRCSGDILSDFLGNTWQHEVQFQILPNVAAVPSADPTLSVTDTEVPEVPVTHPEPSDSVEASPVPELSAEELAALEITPPEPSEGSEAETPPIKSPQLVPPTLTSPTKAENPDEILEQPEEPSSPLEPAEAVSVSYLREHSLQMVDEILQEVVEPVWQDFTPFSTAAGMASPPATPPMFFTVEPVTVPLPLESEEESAVDHIEPRANQGTLPLQLTLNQENLVGQRGQPLTLSGQVDILETTQLSSADIDSAFSRVWQGTLRIELRDPQNSQVLVAVQQPMPEGVLSFAFSCTLELPAECQTRLILGTVTVYDSNSAVLASQSFTVTANLEELLGAISSDENLVNPPLESLLSTPKTLDSSLLDLLQKPKDSQPLELKPSQNQPIPPQIYPPASGVAAVKFPQLPAIRFHSPSPEESTDSTDSSQISPVVYPLTALPPQIYRPKADNTANKSPELPAISETAEAETPAPSAEIDIPLDSDVDHLLDNLLTKLAVSGYRQGESSQRKMGTGSVEDAADESESEVNTAEGTEAQNSADVVNNEESLHTDLVLYSEEVEEELNPASSVDTAFATLHIQERFWARLNSLAIKAEPSDELEDEYSSAESEEYPETDAVEVFVDSDFSPEASSEFTDEESLQEAVVDQDEESDDSQSDMAEITAVAEPIQENPTPTRAESSFAVGVDTDWADQEIVVDDDSAEEERPFSRGDWSRSQPSTRKSPQPETSQNLEDEPVPAPQLILPPGELTAGESVTIRVKLPSVLPHIYVKLWVNDRQTRSLLDGPRWLADFSPSGLGTLETTSQLSVPFGSLSIRFEAVTVDTYTQRESHKVTVDRVVVPPDLPSWSLDEFEP